MDCASKGLGCTRGGVGKHDQAASIPGSLRPRLKNRYTASHSVTSPDFRHEAAGNLPPLIDDPALLLSNPDGNEDRYVGMIDGRAIHFFFLLIEPVLVGIHPAARLRGMREPSGRSIEGAFSPRLLALSELELVAARDAWHCDDLGSITRPCGVSVAVRQLWQVSAARRKTPSLPPIRAALRTIEQAKLSFLIDLAVGCLAFGDAIGPSSCRGCVSLAGQDEGSDLARSLVRSAAECFFGFWLEAECSLAAAPPSAQDAVLARCLFGACVVHEFERRMQASGSAAARMRHGEGRDAADLLQRPAALLSWLERLQGVPLSRELLACWYPRWRRSAVLFRSPLNTVRDLRALHAEELG